MSLTVKLNDGKQIPAVGFGNMHGWENEYTQQAEDVPALALKHGFRHLDTAQVGAVWARCGRDTGQPLTPDLPNRGRDCRRDQSRRAEEGGRLGHVEE